MSTHSHGNSNIQSELLNGKKRCREEIPEPVASPEQEQRSKRKRRKKKKNKAKEEEEPNEHPQPQVCPKPLVATPIPINPEPKINDEKGEKPNEAGAEHSVPDPTSPKDTPKKKKREKKKKNKGAQPKEEPSNTEHPQPQSQPCSDLHHELNDKKEKGNEANVEHTQVCLKPPLDVTIQIDLGKKKGEGLNEATAEHPVPDPTPSNDTPQKKKREKKKKNVLQPQGAQPKEPSDAEHPQPQSCSKPGPGVPTIPIDKSKIKQINRGGRKGMRSDEQVENPKNLSLMQRTLNLAQNKPDSPNPLCPKPSSPIDQTIPVDPAPSICPEPVEPVSQTIPVDTAKLVDTEQETKKQDGKKGNIVLDGAGPNEHNMESSETPIQTSICHTAAPLVGPTVPVDPHPTVPTDQGILVVLEHKASKKKKRKRKSDFKSDGEKPNERNMELIEAPTDTSICHTAAPPVDPHPAIPTAGAISTDPEHKTSKKKKRKKKKKSDLKSEGEKPNEHNGKPPETPVQRSTYPKAAPSIEPATLKVAKQQMTKKKKKSALKIQGAKSDQDDTDLAAETQIRRSRQVPVPKAYYGSSMICQSCLQHGHKFERCPRLRCLSNDEEICFFCGEIGHSLGKCSVSKAGGGRFAKCLLCFETGHFTYDCQRKLQSI